MNKFLNACVFSSGHGHPLQDEEDGGRVLAMLRLLEDVQSEDEHIRAHRGVPC